MVLLEKLTRSSIQDAHKPISMRKIQYANGSQLEREHTHESVQDMDGCLSYVDGLIIGFLQSNQAEDDDEVP